MNKRIKELAEQAGCSEKGLEELEKFIDLERFAELIRQDETKAFVEHYLSIMRDAVEQAVLKERAACAKLCDELAGQVGNKNFDLKVQRQFCAKQIRQRGEK